jgi:uncharacterized protein (UPF0335 family)
MVCGFGFSKWNSLLFLGALLIWPRTVFSTTWTGATIAMMPPGYEHLRIEFTTMFLANSTLPHASDKHEVAQAYEKIVKTYAGRGGFRHLAQRYLCIAGAQLRAFVERIERVEEEIKALTDDKKDIYAEAKGQGFDVKILREIIRIRKQDEKEVNEHATLLDVYLHALSTAPPPLAKAA